jgi:hypothetical protein
LWDPFFSVLKAENKNDREGHLTVLNWLGVTESRDGCHGQGRISPSVLISFVTLLGPNLAGECTFTGAKIPAFHQRRISKVAYPRAGRQSASLAVVNLWHIAGGANRLQRGPTPGRSFGCSFRSGSFLACQTDGTHKTAQKWNAGNTNSRPSLFGLRSRSTTNGTIRQNWRTMTTGQAFRSDEIIGKLDSAGNLVLVVGPATLPPGLDGIVRHFGKSGSMPQTAQAPSQQRHSSG